MPRQWIVLHRVGTDGGAAVDSVRTAADGRYRIRYRASGSDPDALYFVSARYGGIAYFSPPLRGGQIRGGDADVIVYETTADTSLLTVQGRHLVVSAPRGGRREVAEIFELENGGTRTVVAVDTTRPVWTTLLPEAAESASVAPGDVSAGAVRFRAGRAQLFAPVSPGVRQIALTYVLPPDAFPLSMPLGRNVSVLEVLLEEPRASVEGARLDEIAPATIEGRQFRRYLGQNAPASAVMRVNAPPPVERNRTAMTVLGIVMAVVMASAVALWFRRSGKGPQVMSVEQLASSRSDQLVAEMAALDAQFEKRPATDASRAQYESKRAELKAQLARALAGEKEPA